MEINTLNLVYFTATRTTKKVLQHIVEGIGLEVSNSFNITQGIDKEISFAPNDLAIFGVPVYSGRIPTIAVETLKYFKGNSTPAVIVCVFGNRAYEDALLELRNIVEANGFKVISAGAFVAEHSIFHEVGKGRPDEQDKSAAIEFGFRSKDWLINNSNLSAVQEIKVPGDFPYKKTTKIPIRPKGDRQCNKCGACVMVCPTRSINEKNPHRTSKTRCISCGYCITACPQHSRNFRGLLFKIGKKKFVKAFSMRKESETFFA